MNIFDECKEVLAQAEKEYAHGGKFGNFERIAKLSGVSRETVLMVYAQKHMDGIWAHVKGHKLQRETVRGRIVDLINYLSLLAEMTAMPAECHFTAFGSQGYVRGMTRYEAEEHYRELFGSFPNVVKFHASDHEDCDTCKLEQENGGCYPALGEE